MTSGERVHHQEDELQKCEEENEHLETTFKDYVTANKKL